MESIHKQVIRARRRLNLQRFVGILPWALFVALLVAFLPVAIPKIFPLGLNPLYWAAGWVGGCLVTGLFTAFVMTLSSRPNMLDAALELDRRCGFKERVSSALALRDVDAESDAGRALLADAARRVDSIEVRERFPVRTGALAWLPLIPAVMTLLLVLIPDATREEANAAISETQVREQIQRSARELEEKLAKRQLLAEEKGLEDAQGLFEKLREGADELANRNDVDRKKALVKLNELAKELAKRRDAMGDPDQLRRQFDRLKKIAQGPAERLADALRKSDMAKAQRELEKLIDKLKQDELSDEEKQQLAQQLTQMQKKLQQMADAHRQAQQELQRQIQQKMAEGDQEAAGRLQRKLDELRRSDAQMDRLQELASRFGDASKKLDEGDATAAASELAELASEFDELQMQMEQLETIDDLMTEIASAKDAMNCSSCQGEGCAECQGNMFGQGGEGGDGFGDGLGEGQGYGYRPEEKTETSNFESRLRAKSKAGEAVRVGKVDGPNRPGMSRERVKEEIISALNEDVDPLTDQRLPRSQQDHVRQYYQRLGKGE